MRSVQMILFAVLLAVLSACGGDSTIDTGGEPTADLSGTYVSASVQVNNETLALVAGTEIRVSFIDGQVSASAGCNSMGGSFTVTDSGVLQVSDMAMTEMGCDGPRHEQDAFVSEFITSNPVIRVDEEAITLLSDSTRIKLVDVEVAIPNQALFDTQWTFDTFFDQSTARSVFIDGPGWLRFADGSNATGFDGCVEFEIAVEVADGQLQFGTRSDTTTANCDDDVLSYAALIDAALRGESAYDIRGEVLTVTAPNGDGVVLRSNA